MEPDVRNLSAKDTNIVPPLVVPKKLRHSYSNAIEQSEREVSPKPSDAEAYSLTDGCNLPYCPKHGILARCDPENRRQKFRNRSITLDGSEMSANIRTLAQTGRSASERVMVRTECIKEVQKRRMRELTRKSSDAMVQNSIEKRDRVNIELSRRFSAPPRVSPNSSPKVSPDGSPRKVSEK